MQKSETMLRFKISSEYCKRIHQDWQSEDPIQHSSLLDPNGIERSNDGALRIYCYTCILAAQRSSKFLRRLTSILLYFGVDY